VRTAIDALPDALLILDRDRRIVVANQAASQIAGGRDPVAEAMSPGQILDHSRRRCDCEDEACPFRQAISSGRPVAAIDHRQDRQGRELYAEITAAPVADESGEIERVVMMRRDVTERMRAAEAVRKSEERFRHTFEQAAVGMAHVSPRGDFLRVNDRFCRILGYARREIRRRNVRDITFPDDVQTDLERLRDIWFGRIGTYVTEKRYIRKDGTIVWANVTLSLVRRDDGKPEYFIAVVEDVTQRKEAEEEVSRLAKFPSEDPNPVLRISGDGTVLYSNDPGRAMLEAAGWARGRPVEGPWRAQVRQALDAGAGHCWEVPCRERTLALTFAPVAGSDYVNVYGMDVTDRKAALEKVRQLNAELERRVCERTADLRKAIRDLRHESRQRSRAEEALVERSRALDAFFHHSLTPLVILDKEFNFIRVNEAYAKAGARDVSEFPGRNHFEMYPSDAKEIFEEVVRTRKPFATLARPFVYADHPEWGTTYWDWTLVPLTGEDGEVESLVLSLKDVTESVRAHQQLKALNATLARRARQLRALALDLTRAEQRERRRLARMLHDQLQQLLVGARMALSVAQKRAHSDEAGKPIDDADALLGEALEASRSLTLELSPPILHDAGLIPALHWLGRRTGERHGLEVEVAAEEGPEPDSEDVRVIIFHAVGELLFNVVKHARVGRASLTVEREEGWMRVSVIDQGPGFDPDRIHAEPDSPKAFGLFSIRERLEAFGGRLEVESRPGDGTRATLVVPLDLDPGEGPGAGADEAAADAPAVRAPARTRKQGDPVIRVLVADDHEVVRDGLVALFEQEPDIEVVAQAADGREAIAKARRCQPDIVIMDVSMPVLNGTEAARRILRELPMTRVIALSTYDEEDMAAQIREAGATAYLTKGSPAEWLVSAVRAAMPVAQPDRKNA